MKIYTLCFFYDEETNCSCKVGFSQREGLRAWAYESEDCDYEDDHVDGTADELFVSRSYQ